MGKQCGGRIGLPHFITVLFLLLPLVCARGQDQRRLVSPDGQLEFRLFIAQPEGSLSRLAYQVIFHGKRVIDTSFLGLNIHDQEPILGENVGLVASRSGNGTLTAEYMQNGSIGRRITVEARITNDYVEFRYLIPRTSALEQILIEDEATEFDVAEPLRAGRFDLPFSIGAVRISEVPSAGFPAMFLARGEGGVLTAHLAGGTRDPLVAFDGKTPLVCPWRVVAINRTASTP